jgi:tetratricopeptide (TPR) repeat protein/tRNA A-37 threonylcarbamoyl transferase component Bud32
MNVESRVEQLVEELLDSQSTPEVVCETCPELLPMVRNRWRKMRRLCADLDALFPTPREATPQFSEITAWPQVPDYEVDGVLGRGGMGVVFKARHLRLNRVVALKMLLAGTYARVEELTRFRREAEAVATLRHPNIVQVHDAGEVAGRPYFTMEYLEGGSLAQFLAGKPLPPHRAAGLAATLASAVQFAHQSGFIHRDLKPANVLLTADGVPKITDFGLARSIAAGPAVTRSGDFLGTPSYMAPEQAAGHASAVGPAADIYALGAVLYEMLTGRPPFDGHSSVATIQKVVAEEPTPPSRFNAQVPRDLETICLKCLQKDPARRYGSAQDLADDLHRFLDGKPVLARPIGLLERAGKWVRRRPAAALFIAALLVMSGAAIGTGVWMLQKEDERRFAKEQRQGQARDALETALQRAGDLMREERWKEALVVLDDASPHLAEADAPDMEARRKQAQADCGVADAMQTARESYPLLPGASLDYKQRAGEFLKVFEQVGLSVDGDAETLSVRIRSSAIREQLVAALDDRAVVAFMLGDRPLAERFLAIARLADPGSPWRDRFRDLSVWRTDQLHDLAATAFTSSPPPTEHQLALLALLLRSHGAPGASDQLLGEACRRQPRNFWVQREMGNALAMHHKDKEAAGYFRVAVSLRPDNAGVHEGLGLCLFRLGQLDDAIAACRHAVKASPDSAPIRAGLIEVLTKAGYWKEADAEFRLAIERDRNNYLAPHQLAHDLVLAGRPDEALSPARRATEIAPNVPATHILLAAVYKALARHDDAVKTYRAVPFLSKHTFAELGLAQELAALGRWEEALAVFQSAADHNPVVATYSHEMGVILRAHGKPAEAVRAFQEAATKNSQDPPTWIGLAGSLLDLGRFAEARAAVESSLKLPNITDTERRALQRRLRLCNALLPLEAKLQPILDGIERPDDAPTQRALAEWCLKHKRLPATAADLYASAFAAQPPLANDLDASNRFHAACAAALAGCGVSEDATPLDERRRTELRRQALDWLTAEHDAWAERHRLGKPGNRRAAAAAVRTWLTSEDLACVRDERALAQLPAEEGPAWQALWEKVATLAARDPAAKFDQARAHVTRTEWEKAARCYAEGMELEPTESGDLWFEYAAAQLLAGDREGYRRTCAHMLARCQPAGPMRPFLVARACTLAPDSTDDLQQPVRLALAELTRSESEFWALTERGALEVRAGKPGFAAAYLEKSLATDGRPGRAVLNWLWLALAYQKVGSLVEARRWLDKAANWLDQQGGRMPLEDQYMGSHLHNWLEAHVLRQEAEALLR